jgi:hypothetical protein
LFGGAREAVPALLGVGRKAAVPAQPTGSVAAVPKAARQAVALPTPVRRTPDHEGARDDAALVGSASPDA